MTPNHERGDGIDWRATSWEGSRRQQLEFWAQLSLDDIFAAQEEMAEFAAEIANTPVITHDDSHETGAQKRVQPVRPGTDADRGL